jgi:hypothetical protein
MLSSVMTCDVENALETAAKFKKHIAHYKACWMYVSCLAHSNVYAAIPHYLVIVSHWTQCLHTQHIGPLPTVPAQNSFKALQNIR